jgi:hypothetical protein
LKLTSRCVCMRERERVGFLKLTSRCERERESARASSLFKLMCVYEALDAAD